MDSLGSNPLSATHSVTMDNLFHLSGDSRFLYLSNGVYLPVPRRGVCKDEMS